MSAPLSELQRLRRVLAVLLIAAVAIPDLARSGPIEAIRFGLLDHATTVLGGGIESGVDLNLELRFDASIVPAFVPGSPYPILGASFNFDGQDTDQIYGGLTWEWMITHRIFFHFGVGLALHNGALHRDPDDGQRALGQRVLLRGTVEIGRRFGRHHALAIVWDHISNGPFDGPNKGIDSLGLRYSYFFGDDPD